MEYKQVILIRKDLKLPTGKACSQVAHAAVEAVLNSNKKIVKEWRKQGMKKVVLKIKDKKELYNLAQFAKDFGLKTSIITDAGRTTVKPGTVTCCAIGPDETKKIDKVTGKLKMV